MLFPLGLQHAGGMVDFGVEEVAGWVTELGLEVRVLGLCLRLFCDPKPYQQKVLSYELTYRN